MPSNAILARWANGWAERLRSASISTYGRSEVLLGVGALGSLAEVYRVADEQLDEFASPREETIAGFDPVSDSEEPYIAFRVGDTVTVPDKSLVGQSKRMVSITVAEDEDGNADLAPTFGTVVLDEESRLFQTAKKMVNGTLGGRSKVAQPVLPTSQPRAIISAVAPTCADGTWTTLASPTIGSVGAVCTHGGYLYAVQVGGGPLGFDRYNIATNTWTLMTDAPVPALGAGTYFIVGLFTEGDYIYLIVTNRSSASPVAYTLRYDPATNTWTSGLAAMPTVRRGHGVLINGRIYVPGGIQNSTDTLTCSFGNTIHEAYDIAANSWLSLGALPTAVWDLSVTAHGGLLYAFSRWFTANPPGPACGFDEIGCQAFNPSTGAWTDFADFPVADSLQSSPVDVLSNGLIIVSGGSGLCYLYNPDTQEYTAIAAPSGGGTYNFGRNIVGIGTSAYHVSNGSAGLRRFDC